jgi:hypothetical protein
MLARTVSELPLQVTSIWEVVRPSGFEPEYPSRAPAPQAGASAISATGASVAVLDLLVSPATSLKLSGYRIRYFMVS